MSFDARRLWFSNAAQAAGAQFLGVDVPASGIFNGSAGDEELTLAVGAGGNVDTHTLQFEIRRGDLNRLQTIISAGTSTDYTALYFNATNHLVYEQVDSSATTVEMISSAQFRDTGGFYDIVMVYQSGDGTAGDRVQLWVNGTRITVFGTETTPSSGLDSHFFSNVTHYIGSLLSTSDFFDGVIAQSRGIDGTAVFPSSFGMFNTAEMWVKKNYSGSYGTEGWFLAFEALTTDLGDDTSGNANNWTEVGAVGPTASSDSPTAVHARFNAEDFKSPNWTYIEGGLRMQQSSGSTNSDHICALFPIRSGKWYWEIDCTDALSSAFAHGVGLVKQGATGLQTHVSPISEANSYHYDSVAGDFYDGTSNSAYGSTFAGGDTINVAYDADIGAIWFGVNGTWQNSATVGEIEAGTTTNAAKADFLTDGTAYYPFVQDRSNSGALDYRGNFGQIAYSGTAPTGFLNLNSANVTYLNLTNGGKFNWETELYDMDTVSGNTSVSFETFDPNAVLVKNRDSVTNWGYADNQMPSLIVNGCVYPDINGEQQIDANGYISALSGRDVTLAEGATDNDNFNKDADRGVVWGLNADDDLNGFSIVAYTGNGANRTISHSLSRAPVCMIITKLDAGGGNANQRIFFSSVGPTGTFSLPSNTGVDTDSTYFQDTAPGSSSFTLGTHAAVNESGTNYTAWLFAEIPGSITQGSYTGNALTADNGPTVPLGFRPQILYIKRAGASFGHIFDDKRSDWNDDTRSFRLIPGNTQAETNTHEVDFCSWGFKMRAGSTVELNNGTYHYLALGRFPHSGSEIPAGRAR